MATVVGQTFALSFSAVPTHLKQVFGFHFHAFTPEGDYTTLLYDAIIQQNTTIKVKVHNNEIWQQK
jgi:hypothetical protein